jgi:hypothetical protein
MQVTNIHEREIPVAASAAGKLLDLLASENDAFWPRKLWPALRFDRVLQAGVAGGHGPIKYVIEDYRPGQLLKCRFLQPAGFNGLHWAEIVPVSDGLIIVRHAISMRLEGWALLSWPLVVRPLHDALMEDAMALAQASLGAAPAVRPWSAWVKLLRWSMSGGRAGPQQPPIPVSVG